jgi:hypothetical protein
MLGGGGGVDEAARVGETVGNGAVGGRKRWFLRDNKRVIEVGRRMKEGLGIQASRKVWRHVGRKERLPLK